MIGQDAESRLVGSFMAKTFSIVHRCGFTIRLKRLKPRTPYFEGTQKFGSKDNFQHFCKHHICIFVLVQRTFFYCAANKISLQKNEREGLK